MHGYCGAIWMVSSLLHDFSLKTHGLLIRSLHSSFIIISFFSFFFLHHIFSGLRSGAGEMPVEQVPQIVLLTFDDSVNDLNKGLYSDLFERGRVNPNGCPISATFYVSHEWTDYSQVQNLYSDGHEMASHTVS